MAWRAGFLEVGLLYFAVDAELHDQKSAWCWAGYACLKGEAMIAEAKGQQSVHPERLRDLIWLRQRRALNVAGAGLANPYGTVYRQSEWGGRTLAKDQDIICR